VTESLSYYRIAHSLYIPLFSEHAERTDRLTAALFARARFIPDTVPVLPFRLDMGRDDVATPGQGGRLEDGQSCLPPSQRGCQGLRQEAAGSISPSALPVAATAGHGGPLARQPVPVHAPGPDHDVTGSGAQLIPQGAAACIATQPATGAQGASVTGSRGAAPDSSMPSLSGPPLTLSAGLSVSPIHRLPGLLHPQYVPPSAQPHSSPTTSSLVGQLGDGDRDGASAMRAPDATPLGPSSSLATFDDTHGASAAIAPGHCGATSTACGSASGDAGPKIQPVAMATAWKDSESDGGLVSFLLLLTIFSIDTDLNGLKHECDGVVKWSEVSTSKACSTFESA
jgi:hypothetical protein